MSSNINIKRVKMQKDFVWMTAYRLVSSFTITPSIHQSRCKQECISQQSVLHCCRPYVSKIECIHPVLPARISPSRLNCVMYTSLTTKTMNIHLIVVSANILAPVGVACRWLIGQRAGPAARRRDVGREYLLALARCRALTNHNFSELAENIGDALHVPAATDARRARVLIPATCEHTAAAATVSAFQCWYIDSIEM